MIKVKRKKNNNDNSPKRYEDDLKENAKYLKDKYGKDVIIHHKMTYTYLPRRIKAYSNFVQLINEKYKGKYKYIDVKSELSFICSHPFLPNIDVLNNFCNISLAIAIYILDSLKNCGCLSEAIVYIPSERELLNNINLPDNFYYPVYSNELIKGVIFLIEYRNGDVNSELDYKEVFYNEKNINFASNQQRVLNLENGRDKHSISEIQSMSYSQRLKYVISLIPSNVLNSAEINFKNYIDLCTDVLLSEFDYYENMIREENGDKKTLDSEQHLLFEKVYTILNFYNKNSKGLFYFSKSKNDLLNIDNPYEVFFAFFCLLEYIGSDYAWLIELCGLVLDTACKMLPWYKCPNLSSQEIIQYQLVDVDTLNYVYYSLWDGSFVDINEKKDIEETLCKTIYRKEGFVLPQNSSFFRSVMFIKTSLINIIIELIIFVIQIPIFLAVFLLIDKIWHESIPVPLFVVLALLFCNQKYLHKIDIIFSKKILRKILIKIMTAHREIGFVNNKDIKKSKEEYEKELDSLKNIVYSQKKELIQLKALLHTAEKTIDNQKIQYSTLKSGYDLVLLFTLKPKIKIGEKL